MHQGFTLDLVLSVPFTCVLSPIHSQIWDVQRHPHLRISLYISLTHLVSPLSVAFLFFYSHLSHCYLVFTEWCTSRIQVLLGPSIGLSKVSFLPVLPLVRTTIIPPLIGLPQLQWQVHPHTRWYQDLFSGAFCPSIEIHSIEQSLANSSFQLQQRLSNPSEYAHTYDLHWETYLVPEGTLLCITQINRLDVLFQIPIHAPRQTMLVPRTVIAWNSIFFARALAN